MTQYVRRKRKFRIDWLAFSIGFFWASLVLAMVLLRQVKINEANNKLIEPVFTSENKFSFVHTVKAKEEELPVPVAPDVVDIIRFNFGDLGERVVQEAIKVAGCESGLRPTAINTKNKDRTRDDGTFQINSIHGVAVKFLHNPKVNVAVARQLYDEWHGWGAWYSSYSCHHLK